MPWIISPGWKVIRAQREAPSDHYSGYEYLAASHDGQAASCGFGEDGKRLAEMIVQGMNEAAEGHAQKG